MHRFAVFTAASTLVLLWVGGLVTSHGAGMAVPDWPTTYGYNPFFFPISQWVGGVFYEHIHRLLASGIGLLTVILAVWAWRKEERRWVRGLALTALGAVILQGVLGGLRVTAMKDELGVFHATLAQMFFVLVSAVALFTSRWWLGADPHKMTVYGARPVRYLFAVVTGLVLCQLILGASMRHQHAGLAIPDFPSAYGKLWPELDPAALARYNQARGEVMSLNPITAGQVVLQMAHRLVAFIILIAVAWVAGKTRRAFGARSILARLSITWLLLILVQTGLGAATIWTNKAADVATAHVAVGALSLMTGVMLVLVATRLGLGTGPVPAAASAPRPGVSTASAGSSPQATS